MIPVDMLLKSWVISANVIPNLVNVFTWELDFEIAVIDVSADFALESRGRRYSSLDLNFIHWFFYVIYGP